VGIVGESGSGKSVTFASVMGLVRAPGQVVAGEVLFEGRDLRRLDREAMRALRGKRIAMTLQDALTALNPAFTVGQQLVETIVAHDDAVAALAPWKRRRVARERALEMMTLVGIPAAATRLGDYPHQFSGGMRQRIMIAIALVCRPQLLIADEPTTALDVTIQAQVLALIRGLRRSIGMSVVLITHDLGIVAEQCDRVVVMYAGQVVETGSVAEVIESPRHPYTQGLLRATPRVENLAAPVQPIPGTVPSLVDFPAQCRFYSRCALREDACRRTITMTHHSSERQARCLRVQELQP
jgi:oligopeptide/dipeptide ABC transporter ATP-binding protein